MNDNSAARSLRTNRILAICGLILFGGYMWREYAFYQQTAELNRKLQRCLQIAETATAAAHPCTEKKGDPSRTP